MKWPLLFCIENYFGFFPAQLPQFSLFFWLCVQKNFLTASYFAWCLLFEKKIKSLRHAKACGAPFFELKYTHIQPFSNSSGTSLCFPLSGWTASLSFAASSSLCPPLRSFLGQYLWVQQTYNSPFFCYWSGLFWVGLCASAGTGGALQYISHSFN